MYNSISIKGAKKKPKQPRKPVIAKDSAASMSFFKGDYGTSEGEIYGLVDGGKSIFLEGTPLLDDDGNPNFENVTWEERKGTLDQEYMKGFPDVSNEVGIGVELKGGTPWVRSITNTQLSALRLRFKWDRLAKTNPDNGDVTGYRIDYAIDLRTDGGAYQEVLSTKIEDKTSAGYERTHRIDLPKSKTGWSVRVRRITPNADSEYISDKMYIDALAEVIDVKLAYPLTAGIGLQYNAELFNGVAKVEFLKRGRIIKVPTNYSAETREYTGIWDGTFKEAYSNNPAWVYYDLLTNKRYGLGHRLDASMIDKWGIYNLARYCDEMVSDGQGGLEPRFTCNVYLQKQATAYEVLQHIAGIFSALSYWNGEKIFLDADIPRDPVFTFTNANVVGGNFSYSGTRDRDRHNIIKVAWDNPANSFKTEYEYVRDERSIALNGIKPLDLAAFGCTSQSQAQRLGLRALKTEQLETQQVTFSAGLAAINCKVGDVIAISDASLAGKSNGGLISNVDGNVITIDRDAVINIGDTLTVNTAKGLSERRNVTAVSGRNITVAAAFDGAEREHVWSVESSDLKMQLFRVMSVTENDDATYSVLGIQHEPQKFNAIDFGTDVKPTTISIVDDIVITPPESVVIKSRHRVEQGQTVATLIIEWQQVKEAVAYEVEWRKDDGSWIRVPRTGTNSVEIDGVYAGQYLARVRSVGAFDSVSNPTTSLLTEVEGKVGKPPKLARLNAVGILFGMELSWSFAAGSKDADYVEIEQGSAPDTNVSLLGQFSYPTDRHEITGLQGGLTRSYRARLVDKLGFKSDWTDWATATVDDSADKVLDLIEGQITESHLYQELTDKINLVDKIEPIDQRITKEVQDRIKALGEITDGYDQRFISVDSSISDAQDTADAKGEVIFSSTAPEADKQLEQNLWIDTTDNANTPKRWDGSKWVEVTDKVAKDAASAASTAKGAADEAQRAAEAAQSAANEADRKAKEALGELEEISDDDKLTPTEKKQLHLIVDDIKQVDADIKARAAKYEVPVTEYDAAYSALVTDYTDALLTDLSTTSVIDRSEFNSKFNALFAKRAELDTAIAVAAKKVADDAQEAANAAQGAAQAAQQAAEAAAGAASAAKAAADEADRKAVVAQGQVNDIAADGKLTPVEKKQASLIWSEIAKTDTEVRANAAKYKVGFTAYSSAYSALDTYLESLITGAEANTTSIIDRAAFDKAFADVYAARAEVNKLIIAAAEKQAADAQAEAEAAAGTADKAAEDIIRVEGEVSTLKETVDGNTGLIVEEKEIRVQSDAVVTQKLDYLSSEIDMGYADKTQYANKNRSIQWTLATAISAENYTQNQKIENLQSEFQGSASQIQKELLTLASDDLALASDQSRLSARVGQNSSDILSLSLAVQTPGTGLAAQVTHLQSVTEAAERLAGTKGAIIYSVAEPPAKDRLPQNLWFKKEGENTTPHVWDVAQSKWTPLTDKAAATAQAQAKAAKEAAEAAQGVAEAKGEVITSDKIPDATKRMSQNLWIDTRQGKNTPRRWNGSAWESVTDQAAIEAAADIKTNLATYVKESGVYSTEFNNIAGEITTIQSTVEGVTDSIEVVAAIGDAERLKYEISKERLNKNKAALQGKVADLDSLIAKYKAQRTDAQDKKAQAIDAAVIASYDAQIALLNTSITDAETQRSEVSSQVTQLEQEIAELASLKLTESEIKKQYFVKFDSDDRAAGFGIMENADATIDFAVLADKFYIAPPSGSSKGVRPFAVYTSPTEINGVEVPAGTYLDGNLLATGTITGDKIRAQTEINAPIIKGGQININDKFIVDAQGNLTATSGRFEGTVLANKIEGEVANIADASVDTLQIADNAVTIPTYLYKDNAGAPQGGGLNTIFTLTAEANNLAITAAFESAEFESQMRLVLMIDSQIVRDWRFNKPYDSRGVYEMFSMPYLAQNVLGKTITLSAMGYTINTLRGISLMSIGVKK